MWLIMFQLRLVGLMEEEIHWHINQNNIESITVLKMLRQLLFTVLVLPGCYYYYQKEKLENW
jgi:hypothetical protein